MAKKDTRQTPPLHAEEAAEQPAKPQDMPFDVWWAMVQKKMPPQHRKEVILADFKARGLGMKQTLAEYNEALALYGVKLK